MPSPGPAGTPRPISTGRPSSPSLPPPPGAAATPPARSRPPWSYVYAALGLAAVSLALAVGALATGSGGGSEQERKGALDASRERTLALTSYDFRKLDQDFAGVLATSTGPFRDEYAKATTDLRPAFTAAESVATSSVVAAGLESFDSERAVAVVAVDQQIEAKAAPPRMERNRLRMTLVRVGDTWLVERVERL